VSGWTLADYPRLVEAAAIEAAAHAVSHLCLSIRAIHLGEFSWVAGDLNAATRDADLAAERADQYREAMDAKFAIWSTIGAFEYFIRSLSSYDIDHTTWAHREMMEAGEECLAAESVGLRGGQ